MATNENMTIKTSMLFNVLPTIVQCHLPRFPSLRSSISLYGFEALRQNPSSANPNSRRTSGTSTPRDEFSDAISVQSFGQDDATGMIIRERMSLEMGSGKCVEDSKPVEEGSGIGWRFANQGYDLLRLATGESSSINPQFENASFTRQLYIHGITYLLRGLPEDLTIEEELSIRTALPANVVEPLHVQISNGTEVQLRTPPRSLLHRTLASTIVQLFILAQCLLPYIIHFLTAVYQYDREHKVVARAMEQGAETMNKLGRSSLALGGLVLEVGDGRVGQVLADTTRWIVEGITGGIQEGVGEVMLIVSTGQTPALQKR